jgi:hypothetical protein
MAVLSSTRRNSLPASDFGIPGQRKYPMPDRNHAVAAKSRASQQLAKGNISPYVKALIDAKANRKLKV